MSFAAATGQIVPAALQQQPATLVEADGAIGTIKFFFDDQVTVPDYLEALVSQVLVARLQARIENVMRTWIFADRAHVSGHPRNRDHVVEDKRNLYRLGAGRSQQIMQGLPVEQLNMLRVVRLPWKARRR